MGDTENTKKAPKKSFWKGLKAEYKRIIWPDKETVTKQTGAVIAVSVALGLILTRQSCLDCTSLCKGKGEKYGRSKLVCSAYLFRL